MGVALAPEDVSFRLNLVTLGCRDGEEVMEDFSAGHIASDEARQILESLQNELGDEHFQFFPGVSYRHLLVWRQGLDRMTFTPPHDISGQPVAGYMPQGEGAQALLELADRARPILERHPVNRARIAAGKRPANAIWLWGHGRAPKMETLSSRFGITGAVISAVDLVKGIGIYAGLDVIEVPGATGYLDTNYLGKAEHALEALKTRDFVYVHVEAPDEASHGGLVEEKVRAIEAFDRLVVGPVFEGLKKMGDFRLLVLPDHPTPLRTMTHSSGPVPFILYGSRGEFVGNPAGNGYDEQSAEATGVFVEEGYRLMEALVKSPA
jgi:2,3-bisphosphoglycerate-independent phosphoglycerate mutase